MAVDILGREVTVGDFVVRGNRIYQIIKVVEKNAYITLTSRSSSTNIANWYSVSEMCLLDSKDVLAWKLKGCPEPVR